LLGRSLTARECGSRLSLSTELLDELLLGEIEAQAVLHVLVRAETLIENPSASARIESVASPERCRGRFNELLLELWIAVQSDVEINYGATIVALVDVGPLDLLELLGRELPDEELRVLAAHKILGIDLKIVIDGVLHDDRGDGLIRVTELVTAELRANQRRSFVPAETADGAYPIVEMGEGERETRGLDVQTVDLGQILDLFLEVGRELGVDAGDEIGLLLVGKRTLLVASLLCENSVMISLESDDRDLALLARLALLEGIHALGFDDFAIIEAELDYAAVVSTHGHFSVGLCAVNLNG